LNIRTERLLLRPLKMSDAPDIQRLAGNLDVASTTRDIPHPYVDGMAEKWIRSCQEPANAGNLVTFAVTMNGDGDGDGSFIGAIGLHPDSDQPQGELGYWIGKPYWNHGYATEAVEAVINHAFKELALDRVYAAHFTRNPSSGRVMQKAGMRHEGFLKGHTEKWGVFEDLEFYGVTNVQFEDRGSTGSP
jgi:RimJ/RimL family protein N-acetyltransferase